MAEKGKKMPNCFILPHPKSVWPLFQGLKKGMEKAYFKTVRRTRRAVAKTPRIYIYGRPRYSRTFLTQTLA